MNPIAEEILSYLGYADRLESTEGSIDISESMLHSSSNSVAEEIASYYGMAETVAEEAYLEHYGMPRRSGRYPYGSGENPYQHGRDFLGRISDMKKEGFTWTDPKTGETYSGEKAIYKSMGLTSSEYRRQVSWANYEKRLQDVATAKSLKEDGLGATEIGRKMGIPESTVRSLLNPKSEDRMNQVMETVDFLREQVTEKGMIDVGAGVEQDLGISRTRLDTALDYLEKAEGCPVYGGGVPQPTNTNQQSNQKVLCLPGTKKNEIYEYDRVKTINDYVSNDDGETYHKKFTYPESLDSKRLQIRYDSDKGPDGITGIEKDGIIELRPGVKDLSLGESRYSQVRIMVDGTHYLKGMAVYGDPKSFPDGVDVIFNTNKKKGTPQGDVLKKVKADPDNPFGSLIKDADQGGQYWYTDEKTGKQKLGLINKRADEGDWTEWANALPSQFLGKQSITMAKKQLGLAKADKLAEFDEISNLSNPTIKKHLLEKFADNCDSAAVHLKAAALPGQKYHVIIPVNTLKDNEIYAPGYEPGTKLALIRYPHGGTFEIPILTVNNKNKLGNEIIGKKSIDAVGINHKIADQLSGADFDGDTVMCIPTHDAGGKVKIKNKPPLKDLEGFDPKVNYGGTKTVDKDGVEHYTRNGHEYPIMKDTQKQMGVISNLITDMTLAGASDAKLARAVKHSMVVIDAEKHKLDYKASEVDNNIAALKAEFQKNVDKNGNPKSGGASTILSRAKGESTVDKRQGSYKTNLPDKEYYDPTKPVGAKLWKPADDLYYPARKFNKKTGMVEIKTTDGSKVIFDSKDKAAYKKYAPVKKVNKETGEVTYTDSTGNISYLTKKRTQKSTRMAETDDAYSLVSSSRHPMELVYADYANDMKALANKARVEISNTGKIAYSKEAKQKYQAEVKSLDDKLLEAQKNRPREREALRRANAEISAKLKENPNMKKDDQKKLKQRAVSKYRSEVGSVKRSERNIDITDREWEAIQAGAISETKLKQILNNTNIDKLRERATPRATTTPSSAQIARIKALSASNYTLADIAKKTGFSTTTVSKYLKGKGVN
jgi:DNA-binding CsgD family transcriptional regulator